MGPKHQKVGHNKIWALTIKLDTHSNLIHNDKVERELVKNNLGLSTYKGMSSYFSLQMFKKINIIHINK